jgi:flagellar biosynthesis GTPase FlhF
MSINDEEIEQFDFDPSAEDDLWQSLNPRVSNRASRRSTGLYVPHPFDMNLGQDMNDIRSGIRQTRGSPDDIHTHPLLREETGSGSIVLEIPHHRGGERLRLGDRMMDVMDWSRIEEMLGPQAVNILQHAARGVSRGLPIRLSIDPGLSSASGGLVAGIPVSNRHGGALGSDLLLNSEVSSPVGEGSAYENLGYLYHALPLTNNERWWYECKFQYGSKVTEKASRTVNFILNNLIPDAIEERKKKEKEEEERKAEAKEKERLKREQEEEAARKAAEEARIVAEKEAAEAEAQAAAAASASKFQTFIMDLSYLISLKQALLPRLNQLRSLQEILLWLMLMLLMQVQKLIHLNGYLLP